MGVPCCEYCKLYGWMIWQIFVIAEVRQCVLLIIIGMPGGFLPVVSAAFPMGPVLAFVAMLLSRRSHVIGEAEKIIPSHQYIIHCHQCNYFVLTIQRTH